MSHPSNVEDFLHLHVQESPSASRRGPVAHLTFALSISALWRHLQALRVSLCLKRWGKNGKAAPTSGVTWGTELVSGQTAATSQLQVYTAKACNIHHVTPILEPNSTISLIHFPTGCPGRSARAPRTLGKRLQRATMSHSLGHDHLYRSRRV